MDYLFVIYIVCTAVYIIYNETKSICDNYTSNADTKNISTEKCPHCNKVISKK